MTTSQRYKAALVSRFGQVQELNCEICPLAAGSA